MPGRLQRAWRELDNNQRLAAYAAVALLVATIVFPWYEHTFYDPKARSFASENVGVFGKFSFVEAAVLLVALGVLALLFARGERRPFHLPGGDGTVILAAGVWAALLLLWRVFDKPDAVDAGERYGLAWGFFFAFLAAAGLAAAGWKIRAAHRPEPPMLRDEDEPPTAATRPLPARRRPAPGPSDQLTLDDDAEPLRPGEIPRRDR